MTHILICLTLHEKKNSACQGGHDLLTKLLSALPLVTLVSTYQAALESEMEFSSVPCHSDSQVALFQITERLRDWKQFIQNRVMEIRRLIPVSLKFVNAARRKDATVASQLRCTLTGEGVPGALVYWLRNLQLPMPVSGTNSRCCVSHFRQQ